MKKSRIATLLVFFLLIPATLLLGTKLSGRNFYITGTLIILELMLPLFLAFEGRRPQARELVMIAVLCAIGIAGRAAFFMMPQFKPIMALTIIAGVAFGGETGFLVDEFLHALAELLLVETFNAVGKSYVPLVLCKCRRGDECK